MKVKASNKEYDLNKLAVHTNLNEAKPQYELACYFLDKNFLKYNDKQGISWLERSAGKLFPPALNKLGDCYLYGIGVKKDTVKAKEWFIKASNYDLLEAKQFLKKYYKDE